MCKNSPDKFCFVCGLYIFNNSIQKVLTENILISYKQYFGFKARFVDKPWTPNSVCGTCFNILIKFGKGIKKYLNFGKPVEWRNPIDHVTDCYFCLTKIQGGKFRKAFYPDVQSVTKTAPNSSRYPKRQPLAPKPTTSSPREVSDSDFGACSDLEINQKPKLMNQIALNDLCRDLNLSKQKSELLASRLHERGFLKSEVRVSFYRNRSKKFEQYFSKTVKFCYCNNVNELFAAFEQNHDTNEWRLFIDGSKYSVKAVLLHKGNNRNHQFRLFIPEMLRKLMRR